MLEPWAHHAPCSLLARMQHSASQMHAPSCCHAQASSGFTTRKTGRTAAHRFARLGEQARLKRLSSQAAAIERYQRRLSQSSCTRSPTTSPRAARENRAVRSPRQSSTVGWSPAQPRAVPSPTWQQASCKQDGVHCCCGGACACTSVHGWCMGLAACMLIGVGAVESPDLVRQQLEQNQGCQT